MGKHREALAQLDRAAAGYRLAGDRAGLARVELKRSTAYRALAQLDAGHQRAQRARELAAVIGDADLQVSALTQLASLAGDRGDHEAAASFLEQALPLAPVSGNPETQARVLDALGRNANARGQAVEAVTFQTRAIEAADSVGHLELQIRARGSRATAFLGLARYDDALTDSQQAYDISRRTSEPRLRAIAIFSLAQAHAHVWNLDRAAALWSEAIEAYRQAGFQIGVAIATKQRMETWFALADYDRAAADGEAALAMFERSGDAGTSAELTARLAFIEARRGRPEGSARHAARARQLLEKTAPARRLFGENDLGLVELEIGRPDEAAVRFGRVLQLAQQLGNPEYEWRAHFGLGRVALARNRPVEAETHLETAISGVERLRETVREAGLRAAFMSDRVAPYETLVEALSAQSRSPDDGSMRRALEVAERARGRALADLLAESRARLTDPGLQAVREQEVAFSGRFSDVQKRLLQTADPALRAAVLKELDEVERDYEALVVRIRRENPAYAALAYPQALSAAAIARMLAPDEALVEFLLTRTSGFAWVVRRDRLQGYAVPGQEALEPQIRLLQALVASDDRATLRQVGSHLHRTLLGPAEPYLAGARRLIIVPHGVLQRLPFGLLRTGGTGGRWLIEAHAISTSPSATVLESLRRTPRPSAGEPLLAFAAPAGEATSRAAGIFERGAVPRTGLPQATAEIRDIARVLGAGTQSLRLGAAASEGAIKTPESRRYRILHFATHAVVDEVVPRRSAVLLAPDDHEDGLLQLNEIANLALNADLVVLAACRTQVGRAVRGEGLLSVSRAFIHGGARAVVAALWTVNDEDTRFLMRTFYAALRGGAPPDEALRLAQLQMMRAGGRLARPASSAAFVITGDATGPLFASPPVGSLADLAIALAIIATLLLACRGRGSRADLSSGSPPVSAA